MTGGLVLAALLAGGPVHVKAGIHWEPGFDQAIKKARSHRKPLLVDFWADWCGWCHRLDQTTYVDAEVVRLSARFVAVKVDTEGSPRDLAVAQRYDVSSLPTIAFLSPGGHQLLRLSGYQGAGRFPHSMETALQIAERVMEWEDAIDRNGSDAEALSALGTHLFEQEYYEESRDLLSRAIKVDRGRPVDERKRNRMLVAIIQTYDRQYAAAEALLKDALALGPPADYDSKLLYVLGRTYLASGRRGEARSTMQSLLAKHPDSSMADKARETLAALDPKR